MTQSAARKPGVAFWATVVVVVVLMAYPLTFGPACWLSGWIKLPSFADQGLRRVYGPLADYTISEENSATAALWWWTCLGAESGAWNLSVNPKLHLQPYHHAPYF